MTAFYFPGAPKYSTAIRDVEIGALPMHLIPGLKAVPRQDSLLDVSEVGEAYNALAFALYKYGVAPNMHLTFEWNQLGVNRQDQAAHLLSEFNSEMAKWLRVGSPRPNLQRIGRRQGRSAEHFYVCAHEDGGRHGFHTHQLCFVPAETVREFRSWAWRRLAKRAGCSDDKQAALYVTSWNAKTENQEIKRGWAAFRYIVKQLDPTVSIYDNDGRVVSSRSIFKPWPVHMLRPLQISRAIYSSHNISKTARRKANFISRYQLGLFDEIYYGLELGEGQRARQQIEKDNRIQKLLESVRLEAD